MDSSITSHETPVTDTRAARILHVITSLDTGGAEVSLHGLLASLDRSRFDASVVSLAGCFRHQLLLSRLYLLLAKAFTPDFRNQRSCQRYNRL